MTVATNLRELRDHWDLVLSFARRDLRAKYKQTFFGVAWAVLQPLALMIVFTLVFSVFAQIKSEGAPYPVFAYSALIFWTFFAACLSQGTSAMTANASLVRKIWFPRETLLLAVIISASIDLCVASMVLVGLYIYYGVPLHATVAWVPALLALQIVFTLSVILVTSAVQVRFRDVGHAMPLLVQLWMFISPVAYPLESVPERLRFLYLLNPMAGLIDGYRRVLLHGRQPDFGHLAISAAVSLVLICLAYLLFKRAERTFADVI
jgi:ABC-type polysaccharide/polyol phosphate export permease